MEALIVILNDETKLDPLLKTYLANDVRGCTILDSQGMTHYIVDRDSDPAHFVSVRPFLSSKIQGSKTLLLVAAESEINRIIKLTLEVVGDITKPDTCFMMTFKVDNVYGIFKRD